MRVGSILFHDKEGYWNRHTDKSKTITGWLRRKTGFDWHHIHFGFIILLIIIFLMLFNGLSPTYLVFLAIGLSLVLDQLFPWFKKKKGRYFSKEMLLVSIFFHIIFVIITIIIFMIF
jgi:predicted PurR-regulated permease PerM